MARPDYARPEHPEFESYVEKRQEAAAEIREMAKNLPKVEEDWEVIWVLSGPDLGLDENTGFAESEKKEKYNQTKRRWETGVDLVKQVTALRLKKKPEEVLSQDVAKVGPTMYYNATKEGNEEFRKMLSSGRLEHDYQIPADKINITASEEIKHTGHQFEDFPKEMVPSGKKVVVVSDLYHMPRIARYARAKQFNEKVPADKVVLYPAQPMTLPLKMTRVELRKLFGYIKQGVLPPE